MSSDEEDATPGAFKQYHVFVKGWRSAALVELLRNLDALHRRYRSPQGQGSSQGSQPHIRYLSGQVANERKAVAGLPRAAYDANWLAARSEAELEELAIDETPYDFSLSQHLSECVCSFTHTDSRAALTDPTPTVSSHRLRFRSNGRLTGSMCRGQLRLHAGSSASSGTDTGRIFAAAEPNG